MKEEFNKPIFDDRCIEFRYEGNEICIYGTKEGLKKLSDLILTVVGKPKEDHIHLEDYEILTKDSLPGVIAAFDK